MRLRRFRRGAHEEAFAVVVGIDEPAGDVVRGGAPDVRAC